MTNPRTSPARWDDLSPTDQAQSEPLWFGVDAMRLMRRYGWIERRTIRDMTPDERRAYDARTRNAWGKRRHIKRQDV